MKGNITDSCKNPLNIKKIHTSILLPSSLSVTGCFPKKYILFLFMRAHLVHTKCRKRMENFSTGVYAAMCFILHHRAFYFCVQHLSVWQSTDAAGREKAWFEAQFCILLCFKTGVYGEVLHAVENNGSSEDRQTLAHTGAPVYRDYIKITAKCLSYMLIF